MKDSEYQRQFRSRWDKHAPVYDGNVEYRSVRRSVEHNHHSDAFVWDEREWWDSDSVFSAGARPRSGVPLHRYKHEKFNQAYQDRVIQYEQERRRSRQTITPENGHTTPSTPEHEKQKRITNAAKQQAIEQYSPRSKPESRNAMVQVNGFSAPSTPSVEGTIPVPVVVNHATQTNNGNIKKPVNEDIKNSNKGYKSFMADKVVPDSRPKKPIAKPKFSVLGPKQARPQSAPPGRTRKSLLVQPKQPPFLAFGFKDKEREIGAKKTHNVRASADVYPAALRAQRRMELAIKMVEEEARNASNFEKRRRALFNDKPKSDSWDTEYRRNFVGYSGEEYERVLSARLHPLKHQNAYFIPA